MAHLFILTWMFPFIVGPGPGHAAFLNNSTHSRAANHREKFCGSTLSNLIILLFYYVMPCIYYIGFTGTFRRSRKVPLALPLPPPPWASVPPNQPALFSFSSCSCFFCFFSRSPNVFIAFKVRRGRKEMKARNT